MQPADLTEAVSICSFYANACDLLSDSTVRLVAISCCLVLTVGNKTCRVWQRCKLILLTGIFDRPSGCACAFALRRCWGASYGTSFTPDGTTGATAISCLQEAGCARLSPSATEPSRVVCWWSRNGDTWEIEDLAGAVSISTGVRQICGTMPDHRTVCAIVSQYDVSLFPPPAGLADASSVECAEYHCCALRMPYACTRGVHNEQPLGFE